MQQPKAIAFDGGGTGGAYAAKRLELLCGRWSLGLLDQADVLAGTSAGALTACMFAAPVFFEPEPVGDEGLFAGFAVPRSHHAHRLSPGRLFQVATEGRTRAAQSRAGRRSHLHPRTRAESAPGRNRVFLVEPSVRRRMTPSRRAVSQLLFPCL